MSYYYDVAVTFKKDDWDEIYPKLKALDGEVDRWSNRPANTDEILGRASKQEDENYITFHWDRYNYWGDDTISSAIEDKASEYETDYICAGEDHGDIKISENLATGQIELQSATIREQNEPHIEQADRIIEKLMETCMEKGMTLGKIAKSLEGVANKDMVKHYYDKAKEHSQAKDREEGR